VKLHSGGIRQGYDPYSFLPTLGEQDVYLFNEGNEHRIYQKLGAHVRIIKGVPGVGPKTALELIKRFGTVKEMYRQLDAASDAVDKNIDPALMKLCEKFGSFRKEAELSEMLVTLERHAPIDIPAIGDLAPDEGTGAAAKYFEKMGFATLLKRLIMPEAEEKSGIKVKNKAKSRDAQASLF